MPLPLSPPEQLKCGTATTFDSQLYLFESVGFLISLESANGARQQELLDVIVFVSYHYVSKIWF
jgi:hypothetical protein